MRHILAAVIQASTVKLQAVWRALRILPPARLLPVLIVTVTFAVLGTFLLLQSQAAPMSISLETEQGAKTGSTAITTDPTASDGAAVTFGSDAPLQPTGLKAYTGGNSVALLWAPSEGTYPATSYNIFRNGTLVGTANPKSIPSIYAKGTRYTDTAISAGTAYSYTIQAVAANGQKSSQSSALSVTTPATTSPVPTITVDTTAAPDLDTWLRTVIVPEIKTWYPKLSDRLAFPNYTPKSSFKIILRDNPNLVANADGNTGEINAGIQWARAHPEDAGLYIHESTHILESYPQGPGWISEGLADWAREYLYQDRVPSQPTGQYNTYTMGYSQASYFVNWVKNQQNPNFLRDINVAAHTGTYTSSTVATKTGKSTDQWWALMTGRTITTGQMKAKMYTTICVDDLNYGRSDGTVIQAQTCSGGNNDAQTWSRFTDSAGNAYITAFGKCMDVVFSGTADRTKVQLYTCNSSGAQQWRIHADGTVMNVNSGKCLTNPVSPSVGTQLEIQTCDATRYGQLWAAP